VLTEPALNLFRIVQEGLHNVSKHSRASKVGVQLTGDSDSIRLTIFDSGVGFHPAENHTSNGIGIQKYERTSQDGGRNIRHSIRTVRERSDDSCNSSVT